MNMKKFLFKSVLACLFFSGMVMSAFADGTINVSDGTGTGNGWTFANNTIQITANGNYTITGTTTANSVVVDQALTVDVTLDNASISTVRPFHITPNTSTANTTVNLTLVGTNILTTTKSRTAEGGQAGLSVPLNSTVNISGSGSLTATGSLNNSGNGGAGIGSAQNASSGKININGGIITAISLDKAAGIGAGYHGSQGAVVVTGGVVIVKNQGSGESIGQYNGSGGQFKISGGAVVITDAGIYDTGSARRTGGIVIQGENCTFYSDLVEITSTLPLPGNKTLTIPEGKTLNVQQGLKLINDGTIKVEGTLTVDGELRNNNSIRIDGTTTNTNTGLIENYGIITIYDNLTNNGTIRNREDGRIDGVIKGNQPTIDAYPIDVATITASGEGYTYDNGLITLTTADAQYTITGTTTSTRIAVSPSTTVNVIFNNANISSEAPFTVSAGSKAKVTTEGNTTLTGSQTALTVEENAAVIINGTGSININGTAGAGIAGAGTVTVNSGIITVTGGGEVPNINSKLIMDGDGIVITETISDNKQIDNGILITSTSGAVYGNEVTPTVNWTLPANKTLTVDGARVLNIVGNKLTNDGTINVFGTININTWEGIINNGTINKAGVIKGGITGNQPVAITREQTIIDLATTKTALEGWYKFSANKFTLLRNNAEYIITGENSIKSVEIDPNLSVKVTFRDATLKAARAFYISPSSIAEINIEGVNSVTSTSTAGNAGIGVPAGAKVIIGGSGSLYAEGNGSGSAGGAGIGGTSKLGGNIIINSGTITAVGKNKGAGIGGGYHNGYESIDINGGFITAIGEVSGGISGDGIGGYGDDGEVSAGPFRMSGNALVLASKVREKSYKQSGLLFDRGQGTIYGTEYTIPRDLTLEYGSKLTVRRGQKLIIPNGVTLNCGASTEILFEEGSNLINNGTINAYKRGKQWSVNAEKATVTGNAVNYTIIPYDNRDRLYFRFHILAKCLYDNTKEMIMSDAEVKGWQDKVVSFEALLEKHAPNINVVTETVTHTEQTKGSGTGNDNSYGAWSVGESSLKPKCMDVFVAKPTGSPAYAAYYAGEFIHMTPGSGDAAMMHEYAHHVQSLLTAYNPDDGQSWEALYYRYDTMATNFYWERLVKDQGELWDGDNEWLYPDTTNLSWPEDVVFPEYGTISSGNFLNSAKFTGGSGDGKFAFSNGGWKPPVTANGWLFRVTFTPNDKTKHIITSDIPLRFNGLKLDPKVTVWQSDIHLPQTPNTIVIVEPELPATVEYKVQGASNDTYTTTVPNTEGKYTVRVTVAGNDDYNETSVVVNFEILKPTAIFNPGTEQQVSIISGEGFIRINTGESVGKSQLYIYSISGSLVASEYISAGETTIPLKRGLYIVNYEGVRKKLIVR
jgi:hypothetical protein